ncbi:TonB-dependent receptor [Flavihumibacter fluvii]|uniref:TonB-dependent receptor n=1 Tax=Flavihumibacter fluvii TaxID=2838157 RepID=UPI001BDF4376|nr:TonB-dependent receptor [Flavihumibacter fluvii]ULQ53493.1 TonB-dependent receptor [Flavihumibacter fluvii]
MRIFLLFFYLLLGGELWSQGRVISGRVVQEITTVPIPHATIRIMGSSKSVVSNTIGRFELVMPDSLNQLVVSAIGYATDTILVMSDSVVAALRTAGINMEEVVITGTMRAVQRSASIVPVEVYTPQFFRKNPTPSIFEALQLVNGVRPQLNCNVCNTGDIHINGLEGPYTMVLIDGMPIISSLASVYGLQGIPNALVERIEIVKGPASSLYGSEAIGGLINIITRNPQKAPVVSMEYTVSSWREHNLDAGFKLKSSKRSQTLIGINYYNFTQRYDKNADNFTDVTLQNRIAFFGKTSWVRKDNRAAALAIRWINEERFGGEMQWTRKFRGSDSVYGEQISTARAEMIGNYQLPVNEKMIFSFSVNTHQQLSAYGTTVFNADQRIAFAQLTWEKQAGTNQQLLAGLVGRYSYYDDNTPATGGDGGPLNIPDKVFIPGIFLQDEVNINDNHLFLAGLRYDYDQRHGSILTPRLAWKWTFSARDNLRVNAGSGFRVVNLFTEDHAALTGAREVVIMGQLKPEKSYNINLNYSRKFIMPGGFLNLEATSWYTYFTNRIVPDYQTDPDKIIYANLNGYAQSYGGSLNFEAAVQKGLRLTAGITLQEVSSTQNAETGQKTTARQMLTERWSGTWTISWNFGKTGWSADYTGNIYGPMLLPLISDLDPRSPQSPVWSLQNIQVTKKWKNGIEWFGGVKNLLNFTPSQNMDFIIARAEDPFDKQVVRDSNGRVVVTANNPYALTFDPNYVYAPNQGRKIYAGFRYTYHRKAK